MASLRENSSTAVNFFFLVDIFTCTLGIMIFITMTLALQAPPKTSPDLVPAAPGEEVIILRPGEDPPLVRLSKSLQRLAGLAETNAELSAERDRAKALPEFRVLTNRFAQLKLTNVFLVAQTNTLTREIAKTSAVIEKALADSNLTDTPIRITKLKRELKGLENAIRTSEETNSTLARKIDWARQHPQVVWNTKNGKLPVLAVVSDKRVEMELFGKTNTRTVLDEPVKDVGFTEALHRFSEQTDWVVFLVRPSGITHYLHLAELTKQAGFDIGADGIEEFDKVAFARKN